MGRVHEVFQTLDRYDSNLVDALASLRKAAIPGKDDNEHALSARDRELIMVAVRASGLGASGPGASAGCPLPDLSLTEDLVRSANGRVEMDSEAGHGMSVKIYLPQARGTVLTPP